LPIIYGTKSKSIFFSTLTIFFAREWPGSFRDGLPKLSTGSQKQAEICMEAVLPFCAKKKLAILSLAMLDKE
jgi:hypothetical protein